MADDYKQLVKKWDYLVVKLIKSAPVNNKSKTTKLVSKDGVVTITSPTPYQELDMYGKMGFELVGFEDMTFIFKKPISVRK